MHGGGQTRHAWGGPAATLAAQGWRTVSLDLRGHGDSEWALNRDYSFSAYAADAIAVADQLGRPPVIVGASLGGVAAIIAEGTTDRVVSSALVIVDITHRSNPEGIQRIKDFMSSGMEGFATLEDAADAIAAYTPNRPKRVNPGRSDEGAAARSPTAAGTGTGTLRSWARTATPRCRWRVRLAVRDGAVTHPGPHVARARASSPTS
jgi:pimeloyl-ACP methyl ester carboxylesterase